MHNLMYKIISIQNDILTGSQIKTFHLSANFADKGGNIIFFLRKANFCLFERIRDDQ